METRWPANHRVPSFLPNAFQKFYALLCEYRGVGGEGCVIVGVAAAKYVIGPFDDVQLGGGIEGFQLLCSGERNSRVLVAM